MTRKGVGLTPGRPLRFVLGGPGMYVEKMCDAAAPLGACICDEHFNIDKSRCLERSLAAKHGKFLVGAAEPPADAEPPAGPLSKRKNEGVPSSRIRQRALHRLPLRLQARPTA
jgi:hypothetical protein